MLLVAASCWAEENRPAQPARTTTPAKNPLPTNISQLLPTFGNMNMLNSLPQIFWDKFLPAAIEAFAKAQNGAMSGNHALSGNKTLSGNRMKALSENDTRAFNGNRTSLFNVEVNITVHQYASPPPAAAPEKKPQGR